MLNLSIGSALLLRETLRSSTNGGSQPTADAALSEQGVFKLSSRDALILLGLRTDLPNAGM